MANTTIRDLVAEYQLRVTKENLGPAEAAEILKDLTALIGNVNTEIRQADFEYSKKLLSCYELEEKANRAKIMAEVSPEYMRKREAKDTKELVIELIRSLKYYLKAFAEEYQQGGTM
jgi:hypothetical protein